MVKKQAVLTGDYITDASVAFDQFNQPYVTLSFNRQGARIFERVTGENVNKRLAIILDNKVYSAPVIREKISGGRASITGRFTLDEAHDLAIVLRQDLYQRLYLCSMNLLLVHHLENSQ